MIPELEYLLGVSERAKVKRKAAEDEHEKVLRQLSSVENVLSSLPAMVPPDEAAITDTEQVLSGKHARANELSELINNSSAAASALDEQIKSLTRSLSDSKGRLSQREREAEERINGIARKKRELNELLATKDSILNLKDRLPALKTKLAETQAKLEKRNTLVVEINSISGTLTGTRAEVTALRKRLKEAHDIAKLLQEVPCSGEEKQSSCKLLADGVKKAAMVPGMEEELNYLMDSIAMAEQELKEKNLILQSEYPEKTIPQGLLSELSEAQTATARAELLLHAEEQLSELSAEEKKIDANLVEEQKKVADETASVNTALGKARTDREAITLKYNEHKNSKTVLETEMNEISSRLERLRTDRKLFEENERRKNVIGEEIRKYKATVNGLSRDARQWRHIEEGFGREGILSLELELAAPAVSDIANALLTEMGGRFAIRFDTLQPKMTRGKITGYKESFSVKVFDSEKGIEKDLVDLSGGERVWVDEAIARGISIYNSRNTGVDLGLLVSDEKDGALDSEKKLEYIAMKRKVLELGGDRQEIFISHTKDVWELADAVIEVSEAGIALRKGPSIEIDVNAGNNSAAITRGDELPLVENIKDIKKRKKKKEPLPLKQEPLLQVPGHDQVRNIPAATETDFAEQDDEEHEGYSYMSPGRGM